MVAVVSLLVIVAATYILAVVTDKFFIVSLDVVASRLRMPSDVAGASLMAIGSSAPELCIAMVAVILGGRHSDVGIGTIVGSAIFNILVITGASALVAGQLTVQANSVRRDIFFYLVSVGLLLVVFWDGTILLWEALLLLATYVVYLFILWRWGNNNPYDETEIPHPPQVEEEGSNSILKSINQIISRVIGIVARDPEKNFVWALVISIALIAGISYILVEAAVILAEAINIPPVIVSLTILAAGTSAPDMIASMSVARDGRGGMAVANAVGSNIFDILIGLGLPWLVTISFIEPTVSVGTDDLLVSVFLLSGTVLLLYAFLFTGRVFKRAEGSVLILAYVAYVVYAVLTS
ncbi:MAG: calcium/sodium antiporter [Chloroflexi bacterium]|nr:calcium/sodium antiporter [Chloroflexota bacterium]